jgi:hypothetical protein
MPIQEEDMNPGLKGITQDRIMAKGSFAGRWQTALELLGYFRRKGEWWLTPLVALLLPVAVFLAWLESPESPPAAPGNHLTPTPDLNPPPPESEEEPQFSERTSYLARASRP